MKMAPVHRTDRRAFLTVLVLDLRESDGYAVTYNYFSQGVVVW